MNIPPDCQVSDGASGRIGKQVFEDWRKEGVVKLRPQTVRLSEEVEALLSVVLYFNSGQRLLMVVGESFAYF